MEKETNNQSVMRNLNTALLTVCTSAIVWIAFEVNSLDQRTARQEQLNIDRGDAIQKLQTTVNDNATISGRMDVRISRLETITAKSQKSIICQQQQRP